MTTLAGATSPAGTEACARATAGAGPRLLSKNGNMAVSAPNCASGRVCRLDILASSPPHERQEQLGERRLGLAPKAAAHGVAGAGAQADGGLPGGGGDRVIRGRGGGGLC